MRNSGQQDGCLTLTLLDPSLMRTLLLGLVMLIWGLSESNALSITLHVNKDTTTTYSMLVHGCAFNSTSTFSLKNEVVYLDVNEVLDVIVINNDSLPHTFTIDGFITTANSVGAAASQSFNVSFPTAGTYRYYSDVSYGELAGASGLILVGYGTHSRFAWNLFDLNTDVAKALVNDSIQSIPTDYQPELFFINGFHFPNTLTDVDALVDVNLGDTVVIGIVNSGNMEHILHFHGFHVEILQASVSTDIVGWIKDSVPIRFGERITVKLIADQTGDYPVHDHNLIAVTNAGFYPGGMITQINVGP